MTDAGLHQLAASLPQLTRLSLSEAQHVSAAGLAAALPLLPVLADLDLTACSRGQLTDDHLLQLLAGSPGSGSSGSPGSGSKGGAPAGAVTPANIQLPQGGTSPTGSPFRRRAAV